jgi:hypothetical protein
MATAMKETSVHTFETAADRVRDLNERVIESSSRVGLASLEAYARLLERIAEAQERAGRRGGEWLTTLAQAQATFTRELGHALPAAARGTAERAREAPTVAGRQARRVPAAETRDGEFRGAVATNGDLPIARYDDLNVKEIDSRLSRLSTVDLAKIDAYERTHKNRATVLKKIESLRS